MYNNLASDKNLFSITGLIKIAIKFDMMDIRSSHLFLPCQFFIFTVGVCFSVHSFLRFLMFKGAIWIAAESVVSAQYLALPSETILEPSRRSLTQPLPDTSSWPRRLWTFMPSPKTPQVRSLIQFFLFSFGFKNHFKMRPKLANDVIIAGELVNKKKFVEQ